MRLKQKISNNAPKEKINNILIKKEISSKYKAQYDKYCEAEKEYEKKLRDLETEKKVLNKENDIFSIEKKRIERERRLNLKRKKEQERSAISKENNCISRKVKEEEKKIIKEYELKLEDENQRYKSEKYNLEVTRKKDSILKRIFAYFNGYYEDREEEINIKYRKNVRQLESERDEGLKRAEKKGKDELEIFENSLLFKNSLEEEINTNYSKSKMENNKRKIDNLSFEIDLLKSELNKILINKNFIECGDKDLYYELNEEIEKILKAKVYPSYKKIKELGMFADNFISKYKNKIDLLKDVDFTYMNDISTKNYLNIDYLKKEFLKKELKETDRILSDIDGKSLDEQQRNAVVTNEDNNLVIAGAGSGKTLTISAKVKYLVDSLHVNPKDILLITFTKKAAEEMEERITKKLGINVNVKTFHALGYDLLGIFESKKPEIYDDMDIFTSNFMDKVIWKNKNLQENIFKYFTTYINEYINPEDFDSLGEFYMANKSNSLETIETKIKKMELDSNNINFNKQLNAIKSWVKDIYKEEDIRVAILKTKNFIKTFKEEIIRITNKEELDLLNEFVEKIIKFNESLKNVFDSKNNDEKIKLQEEINEKVEKLYANRKTLKLEKVKSIEELIIANYLFSCGVKYVYEGNYKYDTSDKNHRQYKPDFYLPDYDIYIEHFGINEEGKCPQYSEAEEASYIEGINWKRELHKKNKTIMEETYSYEHKQGKLIVKLNSILRKYKIPIKKLSSKEIAMVIKNLNTDNEFKEFYKLLNTFLSLFKSCNYKESDIEKFKIEAMKLKDEYLREKHSLFLNIFKFYYAEYVKELDKEKKIDFSDMINRATNYIDTKGLPEGFKFKYIIIDEFQDISVARYRLVKAIKDKTDAKVMAVGDDWQSIYRFAGSEISIFTKFEEYFGKTEVLRIEKTYRNSQKLIDIAGKFVMNNPEQIKKDLKSDKKLNKPVILVDYSESELIDSDENKNSLVRRIMFILNSFGKIPKSVLLLGRNNFDIKKLEESKLFRVNIKEGQHIIKSDLYPNLNIKFMSVHKSKGIEADEVIIINNKNDLTGFPNKMISDTILSYVMKKEEGFMFAEERRLFYVALTRTKNHCYLMCPEESSTFIEELKKYTDIEYLVCDDREERIKCPICKTGHLVQRTGTRGKSFYSCSNFPQCNFKINDSTNIKSKVRCPSCGNFMTLKKGLHGEFYGCNSFPYCKTTYSVTEFEKLENKK